MSIEYPSKGEYISVLAMSGTFMRLFTKYADKTSTAELLPRSFVGELEVKWEDKVGWMVGGRSDVRQ